MTESGNTPDSTQIETDWVPPEERRIILGVPTRTRPESLRRCITSALATSGLKLAAVVVFDDDLPGYRQCPPWPQVVRHFLTPRHYYVRAMNKLFGLIRQLGEQYETDYFVVTNDDSEFLLPGWGPYAIDALEHAFPDGEGGMVEMFCPNLCVHYISKISFVDKYLDGRLADPVYTMYFSDSDLHHKVVALKRYAALALTPEQQILQHNQNATRDYLAREVQEAWMYEDQRIFEERYPQGPLPSGAGKLLALQEG